jgi:branched-chain amino acid transport system ATP-binding protein
VFYGEVQALHQVSLELNAGEIVALLGANGAGKSTVLRTISSLVRPVRGQILLDDRRIDSERPTNIANLGISHVPEGRRIFPGLTVYENLELATTPWFHRGDNMKDLLTNVFELFPVLEERQSQFGWSLSGGEQQMLAIGRALMAQPQMILLDEPSLGLAPSLVHTVFEAIQTINKDGTAILLVEQNAFMALQIADRAYVLENGEVVLSGDAKTLAKHPKVKAAYLGG